MGNDSSKAAKKAAAAPAETSSAEHSVPPSAALSVNLSESEETPLSEKKISLDDFELLKVIGRGSFGKVYLARCTSSALRLPATAHPSAEGESVHAPTSSKSDRGSKTKGSAQRPLLAKGHIFALKVMAKSIFRDRQQVEQIKQERLLLESMQHPFITRLTFAWQSKDKIYLVTPFCSGGEVFHWLKAQGRFPEARVRLYAAELLLALQYMHSKGVLYRDLKPENILLDGEGHIVLTDFGLSKQAAVFGSAGDPRSNTFCGTPEYLSPEVLLGQARASEAGVAPEAYGSSVDWWALGTILWEMLHGLPPYYSTDQGSMYRAIVRAALPARAAHISEACYAVLAGLLDRDVGRRLAFVATLKQHAWFSGLVWQDVLARKVSPDFIPPANGVLPGERGAGAPAPSTGQVVVSNFDSEFTQEEPLESLKENGAGALYRTASGRAMMGTSGTGAGTAFENFTYTGRTDRLDSVSTSVATSHSHGAGDQAGNADGRLRKADSFSWR